ncbi:MAG: phosphodiesterase [Chloroflexi bacterium]|nr:MAG: phosphodiesterase [Chloroflexota bacterium]
MNESFIAPRFDGYNFSNLPATIQYWLTGQGAPALAPQVLGEFNAQYDVVILFFIDSFGWEFFQRRAGDAAFLKLLEKNGRVSKITSQFPSTTAAHVTCIHTGLPVGQSGVYEWQYYEPKLDAVITPLLYSYAGTMQRDQLKNADIKPEELYPSVTLYNALAAAGVKSFSFGSRDYTPSTFSNVTMRGAELRAFATLTEALVNLAQQAERADSPTYLFFYYGAIDAMCHHYGPASRQAQAELDMFLYAMDKWFLPNLRAGGKRVLFALTADHGHMAVAPENTFYLNLDARASELLPMLRADARGQILPPAGSPRDVFLYVRPEYLDAAHALLQNALAGFADVVKTDALLNAGYFGAMPVCAELLGRLGNLTLLPYENNCVWWFDAEKFSQRFYGHHGGLTPTEMEIPLALMKVD